MNLLTYSLKALKIEKICPFRRFLWVRNLEDEDPEITVFCFKTVLFGLSCSPFGLNAKRLHIKHFYKENMEKAEKLLRGFYIDDWTCGGANTEEAFELIKEVKTCLAADGFNLRKWASNSEEVSSQIANYNKTVSSEGEISVEEDKSFAKNSLGGLSEIEPGKKHKILGLNWSLK